MANEAATTIVLRMRDEASASMQNFGQETTEARLASLEFNSALTAMGGALTAVGSLVGQLGGENAKMAATFITTAGAILTTTSAIIQSIPYIRQMITWIRNLAIAQAVLRALSGPAGWVTLGVGLAVAGAATAGIMAATGGFSGGGGGGTTVNVNSQAFAGNEAEARKFGSKVQRFSREGERLGR